MSTSAAPEPVMDPPAEPITGTSGTGTSGTGTQPDNGGMPSGHVEGPGIQPMNGGMPSAHVEEA